MLKRLYVDNFKGLLDFTIHFTEPLSVLAGPNGAGKTSICQALDLLFRLAKERPAEIMKGMDPALLKNKWKSTSTIVFEADFALPSDDGREMDLTWHIEISKKKGWGVAAERVTHRGADIGGNPNGEVLRRTWRTIDVYNHATAGGPTWQREYKELPSYLAAVAEETRAWYPELYALQQYLALRYVSLLNPLSLRSRTRGPDLGNQGENFASYLHRFARERPDDFKRVTRQLQEFFPTLAALRPVRSQYGWTEVQVVQNVRSQESPVVFKADQVSDGLLRLAAIATLPYADEALSTLAIEEPENGMHPKLLERAVELLRSFQGIQLIVTTHSPVLLNFVRPEEVIILRSRGKAGPEAKRFVALKAGMKRLEYYDIGDVVYQVGEDRLMRQAK